VRTGGYALSFTPSLGVVYIEEKCKNRKDPLF